MKLIGSRTEEILREELVGSNLALRDGTNGRLAKALEFAEVNIADAYVLDWIPEQGEEIFTVLVSASEVVTLEVPREGGQILLERHVLADYEHKLSMSKRLKIAIAKDLMASKASKHSR